MEEKEATVLTVKDYLINLVKFDMPAKALTAILSDRGLEAETPKSDVDSNTLRLCYADMLKWMAVGPSRVSNTSDSDNGWSHSAGGYQLTDNDIKEMKSIANGIYGELEPASVFGRKLLLRVNSAGIMRANRDLSGNPLPHIIK